MKVSGEMKENYRGKKCIIYGAGIIARVVIEALREKYINIDEYIIGCAVTSMEHKVPLSVEGVMVYGIEDLAYQHKNAKVLICVKEKYCEDIKNNLKRLDMNDYENVKLDDYVEIMERKWKRLAPVRYSNFMNNGIKNLLSIEEYIMFLSKQLRYKALDFEVNLADHCNLNCQCCNHFSPIASYTFLNIVQYENDIKRMAELFEGKINTLALLGGEPLLYPQIERAMQISREYLPETEITIVTNGLLLPQMKDSFWKACREWKVALLVTKYPIGFNYEGCVDKAKAENVKCAISYDSETLKTTYKLPLKENAVLNPYKNYMKCYHANQCVVLREGRLYTCPLCANVHHFNKFFGKNIPEREANSIDIYAASSYEEIDDFLKTPIPMCEHCDVYNYVYDIPWNTSKRSINEWM